MVYRILHPTARLLCRFAIWLYEFSGALECYADEH